MRAWRCASFLRGAELIEVQRESGDKAPHSKFGVRRFIAAFGLQREPDLRVEHVQLTPDGLKYSGS